MDFNDIPSALVERVRMMENILISRATGGSGDSRVYEYLRLEFMQSEDVKNRLPSFVRENRTLEAFWPFIKHAAGSYADRRYIIIDAFTPLIDYLEERHRAPGDDAISDILEVFDAEGVHAVWIKAMQRRKSDPEGAITVARRLLETVCKKVLDENQIDYTDKEDLPKLYGMAAKSLKLAPDQHSEEPIKAILGGAMTLVNGLGTLRNKLSDSHGRGGKRAVKPSPRHASLAVNISGAFATFLVETYNEKCGK